MLRRSLSSFLNFVLPSSLSQELPPDPPRLRPRTPRIGPPKTSINHALAESSAPPEKKAIPISDPEIKEEEKVEEKIAQPITPKHVYSFNQLKTKEADLDENKHRRAIEHSRNITAALEFTEDTDEEEYMKEHAARRVDLFFYQCILYYKSNILPAHGETLYQHGIGTGITHACHSSFFPSLIDQTIYNKQTLRYKHGHTDIAKKSIVEGKHFFDSLNATVELPKYANNLDCELEGKINNPSLCRRRALDIIRNVAIGNLDPVQGLHRFLKIMNITFINLEEGNGNGKSKSYIERVTPNVTKRLKKRILELAKTGTLTAKFNPEDETITTDYINLLLRLTPEEKIQCNSSEEKKQEIYQRRFTEIHDEIMNTSSEFIIEQKTTKRRHRR